MGKYKDEHGKTRVGKFLQGLGPIGETILDGAADLTGMDWLSKLSKVITGNSEMTEQQKQIALEAIGEDLKDVQNARQHDVDIQTDENTSWVARNLPYFFDAYIFLIWGFLTVYLVIAWMGIIQVAENINMTGILGIWGGVTGSATTVLTFHRGSSRSSQKKDFFYRTADKPYKRK